MTKPAPTSVSLTTLLTCCLLSGCAGPQEAPPPNVLLVSIDTLRADHLGCYGHERDTSPVLDALAAGGVRFAAALAPTPWTFPSHAAMLTGMHPYEIGIDGSLRTIPEEVPRLAQVLAAGGYQTAAFTDSSPKGFVGAERGFGRGFEHYAHAPHRENLTYRFDAEATVDAVREWLHGARDPARPFFLFVHTKAVHAVPNDAECPDPRCFPYDSPHRFRFVASENAPFAWTSEEDGAAQRYLWSLNAKILDGAMDPDTYPAERVDVLKALYDGGIYNVDEQLGRLLDELRTLGLAESTAIVVTADHGEAFLEHNLFMHQEVYDTQLRVPLIVRLPGGKPGVVDPPVTLSDIPPTVVRMAGLDVPAVWSGRPLPLDGTPLAGERDHFAYYLFPDKFTYQSFALRRGPWKLVFHNSEEPTLFRQELYNIEDDPGEQHPLGGMDERVDDLRRALQRRVGTEPVARGKALSEEELPALEAVRALGYVE